ncbi:MAG: ABC transporter permease [Acidobacteriia bacterium]|nr:ABC transporter permease [Terriglobia bacterium]
MTTKLRVACGILAMVHGVALLADFVAPYPFAQQQRDFAYAPPTQIHWISRQGQFHLRPFIEQISDSGASRTYFMSLFVHGYSYRLAGLITWDRHLFGVERPGVLFVLGSDAFGRDQFSRLVMGSRISLTAGWFAAILSLILGSVLGSIAGLFGGWADELTMRASEASMTLPWLYLLLAGRAFLPLDVPSTTSYFLFIAVVGVLGWARPARLVRGLALSLRERGYILAARGFGASDGYILRVHILPDALSVLVTQAALLVPQYILAEVTLSFLGLGIDEPAPSWGNMLAGVQHYNVLVSYRWMLLPALAPALVSLCCFTIADAMLSRRRVAPL